MTSCGADPLATARNIRANNPQSALHCYDLVVASTREKAIFYEAAGAAYEAGDSARLMTTLRSAVQIFPTFGDAYFELGNALTADGKFHEAIPSYRAALRCKEVSDRPMVFNNLGNVLGDSGDYSGAMKEFRKGLRLSPTFTYLHNGLANVLASQSRDNEAVATLRRALHVAPTAHYAHYNLANALRRLKRTDESERHFVAALDAVPDDWRYLQGLGQLRHETRRLAEAIDFYRRSQQRLSASRQPRNPPLERDTASALREAKRYDEAEAVALRALELDPTAPESYTTIAGVLKEAKRLEESAAYMKGEAETDVTSRAAAASPTERAAAASALALAASRDAAAGRTRRLVIFCRRSYSGERSEKPGSWEWGPHAKERGIGGSESAVIALSRELVGAGWGVRVYGSPPAEDVGVDDHGVAWLPHWAYRTIKSGARGDGNADQTLDEGEVFVAWRFAEALHVGRHAARRYLWLHDEVQVHTVPRVCIPLLAKGGGGIFVLSAFHRSQLPPFALPYAIMTSNGLESTALADGPNHNDHFLYASTPTAGLHLLLTMWPRVREAVPNASLDVYYGFWPYAMWNDQKHLVKLRKQIEPLLEQPGVRYHGMQSEAVLAQAYARAGFYAYPTDKAETSGIALMKAQSCGCIPVTSGQPISAAPETCGEFDLGARGRPGYIGQDPDWQRDYVDALLAAARRPSAELTALRTRMKSSARQRFSWRSVAAQWSAVFQNATAIAPPEADDAKGTLDAPSPPNGIQARRRASGAATRSPSARKSPPVPPSSQPRVKQTEQGMQKVFLEVGLDEVDRTLDRMEAHIERHTGDAKAELELTRRLSKLQHELDEQRKTSRQLQQRARVVEEELTLCEQRR